MNAHAPLLDALQAAVPLEITSLRAACAEQRAALAAHLRMTWPRGKPGTPERTAELAALEQRPDKGYPLGAMDDVLFGGPRCAAGFAALARALAVLSFEPGGVRFGPLHWCGTHPRERWPAAGTCCPACLREAP